MATIVLAWELGAGLGHVMPLSAIGRGLVARDHRVVAVLRDINTGGRAFSGTGIPCFQAPFKQHERRSSAHGGAIVSFAHMLETIGFHDPEELACMTNAWRTLFSLINPDLVVFDHCPTAQLAMRGRGIPTVLFNIAFAMPPETHPLPTLRTWLAPDAAELAADESRVMAHANAVLASTGQPRLSRLADLYYPADDVFIHSIPLLDPYAPRGTGKYVHIPGAGGGETPRWPDGARPRVFAYLKPFAGISALLSRINERKLSAIVYAPGISEELRRQHSSPNLAFAPRPVNIDLAAETCDLAILNATNATTIQMLRAGKPALHVPIVLEQVFNARAIVRCGAGLAAPCDRPDEIVARFDEMLSSPRYAESVRAIAASNAFETRPIGHVLDRIDALLSSATGRRTSRPTM